MVLNQLMFPIFWKPVLVEEQNKSSIKIWGYDIEKTRVLYLLSTFIKMMEKTHQKKQNSFFSFYVSKSEVRHVLNSSITCADAYKYSSKTISYVLEY